MSPYFAGDAVSSGGGRPRPRVADPLSAPHWDGTRSGQLVFQVCSSCGYVRWPAALECPECLGEASRWQEVGTCGRLWSLCTYERAISPAWAADAPYVVAAVQLDAGPFLFGRLVEGPDEPRIGSRVEAVFRRVDEELTLVDYRIVGDHHDHQSDGASERNLDESEGED